jgi:clathrin heavy chain
MQKCVDLVVMIAKITNHMALQLHIVEIDHSAADAPFATKAVDVYFPLVISRVAMQVSKKHRIIYPVTKYGVIHLYQ